MAVRKRGEVWYTDFQINGRRHREALPQAKNKEEAKRLEAEKKQAVYEGRHASRRELTFGEFVASVYLPWSADNKRSHQSDLWRSRVLVEHFGDTHLSEIVPFAIEQFKVRRREGTTTRGSRRSAASVNREFELLSRVLSMAVDHAHIAENPCRKVRKYRLDNQRTRYLSRAEEARLLAALAGSKPYLRDMVVIALHTGMRRGEIRSLAWRNVDLEQGLIFVTLTKTFKNRTVPVNDAVREVLRCVPRADAGDADELLFEVDWIEKSWRKACEAAGLRDLRFHDLRHTFATRLAEAGADAFTIASLLGHSSIQMAARYTHATDAGRRAAVEKLAASQICHKGVGEGGVRRA